MQMTNEEIAVSYRDAKDRTAQLSILAELNNCTVDRIVDELKTAGADMRELGPRVRTIEQRKGKSKGQSKGQPKGQSKGQSKAYTAAELLGQTEPDLAVLSARIDALLEQRDSAEKELRTISETLAKLLLKMKDGGSDD